MHSDYNFRRMGSSSALKSIDEQSFGAKLKALVTGKAPKKLTKKRRKK